MLGDPHQADGCGMPYAAAGVQGLHKTALPWGSASTISAISAVGMGQRWWSASAQASVVAGSKYDATVGAILNSQALDAGSGVVLEVVGESFQFGP